MIRLIRRRLAVALPVLFATSVGMFLLGAASPMDPAKQYAGAAAFTATEENLAQIRANWGVDDPLPVQYLRWLGRLARGDLGLSYASRTPVIEQVLPALWITLSLVVVTLGVAAAVSVVLGTVAALQEGRPADRVITTVTQAFIAMPEYWLAPMLVLVFALQLSLLPSAGWEGPASAVLPVAVLALRPISYFTSAVREGMLEALGAEHVVAARARGLSHAQAVRSHVLPNGLLPLTTLVAVWFAGLLGGSVIVEVVFAIPGMGRLLFDAVRNSDIPLAQGGVVVVVGLAVVLTTAADLVHGILNPRIRGRHA